MCSGMRLPSHRLEGLATELLCKVASPWNVLFQEAPLIKAAGEFTRSFATEQAKNSSAQSHHSVCHYGSW